MEIALALLSLLGVIVPFIIWWYKKRSSTRVALARTEVDELIAGMDAVDELDKRVLPPPKP